MAELISINGGFKNKNVIANEIHYITRTRFGEDRKNELILFGACGVSSTKPEIMIQQFSFIQEVYLSKNLLPRRVFHEVFSLSECEQAEMVGAMDLLNEFAQSCCSYYFNELGFQSVYAIHLPEEPKHLHIHFIMNATSWQTGKKHHESEMDFNERRRFFQMWFVTYLDRAMKRKYQCRLLRGTKG